MPVAVVRAEKYYLPPSREPGDVWADVPAAELIWKWMEYRTGRRLVPPTETIEDVYFARINQNRWLADCNSCGSAAIVSPTDPRFACTECNYGWVALIFPADPAAVEASLLGLKPGMRNWWNDNDPTNPDKPLAGEAEAGPSLSKG